MTHHTSAVARQFAGYCANTKRVSGIISSTYGGMLPPMVAASSSMKVAKESVPAVIAQLVGNNRTLLRIPEVFEVRYLMCAPAWQPRPTTRCATSCGRRTKVGVQETLAKKRWKPANCRQQ